MKVKEGRRSSRIAGIEKKASSAAAKPAKSPAKANTKKKVAAKPAATKPKPKPKPTAAGKPKSAGVKKKTTPKKKTSPAKKPASSGKKKASSTGGRSGSARPEPRPSRVDDEDGLLDQARQWIGTAVEKLTVSQVLFGCLFAGETAKMRSLTIWFLGIAWGW